MKVDIPTHVLGERLVQRRGHLRPVDGDVMLVAIGADVAEQSLEVRNPDHPR